MVVIREGAPDRRKGAILAPRRVRCRLPFFPARLRAALLSECRFVG